MALGLAPGAAMEYSTTPPATGRGSGVTTGEGHGEELGEGQEEGEVEIELLGIGVRGGGGAAVGPLQPATTRSTPKARARIHV